MFTICSELLSGFLDVKGNRLTMTLATTGARRFESALVGSAVRKPELGVYLSSTCISKRSRLLGSGRSAFASVDSFEHRTFRASACTVPYNACDSRVSIIGVQRSPAARFVRNEEVRVSSPRTPTIMFFVA